MKILLAIIKEGIKRDTFWSIRNNFWYNRDVKLSVKQKLVAVLVEIQDDYYGIRNS